MRETYCVVYRTGGTDNFRWHRSLATSYGEAIEKRDEMREMGYVAMLENYHLSMCAGLPETYSYVKPFA